MVTKNIFSKEGEVHLWLTQYDKMEAHLNYISYFSPQMVYKKTKCIRDLQKFWKSTRTATPVTSALKYILTCIMNEIEPFPRRFSTSPIQAVVYHTWQEQRIIGWGQLFKGRLIPNGGIHKKYTTVPIQTLEIPNILASKYGLPKL